MAPWLLASGSAAVRHGARRRPVAARAFGSPRAGSMAVRGVRPTVAEVDLVRHDPAALSPLVASWLQGEAFGATVRDMWAEILLLRDDTFNQLPALGALCTGYTAGGPDLPRHRPRSRCATSSTWCSPTGPFTDIVTGHGHDHGRGHGAQMYGVPYDLEAGGWQLSDLAGCPSAGPASCRAHQVWRRWESDGSQLQPGSRQHGGGQACCARASTAVTSVVDGGVDIADENAVAPTRCATTGASCVTCHQSLDALAVLLLGLQEADPPQLRGGQHHRWLPSSTGIERNQPRVRAQLPARGLLLPDQAVQPGRRGQLGGLGPEAAQLLRHSGHRSRRGRPPDRP